MNSVKSRFFNIALSPMQRQFGEQCVTLARKNLCEVAQGYLLGNEALPHITLCQFHADPENLSLIWADMKKIETKFLPIRFHHLYLRPEFDNRNSYIWVGLAVSPNPKLIALQATVYEQLLKHGIWSHNTPMTYFPHLTFGRAVGAVAPWLSALPDAPFWHTDQPFALTLGCSDEIGVYTEQLYTA